MSTAGNPDSPQTAAQPRPKIHPERKRRVRTALTFFSVSAWVTGVMLLLLVVRMIMEYILNMDVSGLGWIAILHGWVYLIFVIATFNLGLKARWEPKWWITTIAGGVVPLLSFFVENNRRKQVRKQFQLDEPDQPAAS
ncbi:MAG TPA: DUF3817 domain-containing protein [Corynebacterium sp.]|nr:DUF3817 domain-containing protein [Corynebacterium sp.]